MKYKVTLNDRIYEVEVDQNSAMLVDEYASYATAAPAVPTPPDPAVPPVPATTAPAQASAAGTQVNAPMPGSILKILVSQGQQVNEGDVLIILEAMKMENEIVAPKTGTVARILASRGAKVETGTLLAVIA